jgi:hypothetical protein
MMSTKARLTLTLLGLGVFPVLASQPHGAVAAQHRTPVRITKFITGSDNVTHAEEIEVQLKGEGSGRAFRELSEKVAATEFRFHRNPPVFFSDWHTAPRHYYVLNLNGREDFELSDGTIVPHYPGHILEAADFTGKGHISRGLGVEDRIALFVSLAK